MERFLFDSAEHLIGYFRDFYRIVFCSPKYFYQISLRSASDLIKFLTLSFGLYSICFLFTTGLDIKSAQKVAFYYSILLMFTLIFNILALQLTAKLSRKQRPGLFPFGVSAVGAGIMVVLGGLTFMSLAAINNAVDSVLQFGWVENDFGTVALFYSANTLKSIVYAFVTFVLLKVVVLFCITVIRYYKVDRKLYFISLYFFISNIISIPLYAVLLFMMTALDLDAEIMNEAMHDAFYWFN
jgi:hypothetical protein